VCLSEPIRFPKDMRKSNTDVNSISHWDEEYRTIDPNNCFDGLKNLVFSGMVEDGKKVLDMGCGIGFMCRQVLHDKSSCEVWGIDYSAEGIVKAKIVCPNGNFAVMDIYDTDFEDHSFDYVFCCEVLEHLEKPELVVKEMARVTRGSAMVTVPYLDHIPSMEHIQEFDYPEMEEMFKKYFNKVWVSPMASGRYTKNNKTNEVVYPSGHWDEIFVIAKEPKI
jgi:ubiquinone/menaquinone biosynthesis C-methylase UbiE